MKRRLSKNCNGLLNLHVVADVRNIVRTVWTTVNAGMLRSKAIVTVFLRPWRSGNKAELFSDLAAFPVLKERKEQIQDVTDEIHNHRKEIRLTLKVPTFDYTSVSGQEVPSLSVSLKEVGGDWWSRLGRCGDLWCLCACLINGDVCSGFIYKLSSSSVLQFLIEVKNSLSSSVPPEWVKVSRWCAHTLVRIDHNYLCLNFRVLIKWCW